MQNQFNSVALFRLSVLGPLASRGKLAHGELKAITKELATKTYQTPNDGLMNFSEQTIRRWYYSWQRGSIEGLIPTHREDKGRSHLSQELQDALIAAKRDNPTRSINTLIHLLETQGVATRNALSRASVHRFLKGKEMSRRVLSDSEQIERRAFVVEHAGQLWHADVMHGPRIQTRHGSKKTYLVSFIDDASRLLVHSEFCLSETALAIEGVLKQALLKRGMPCKILLDNGAAYISDSFKMICASLEIQIIYCRPYEPQPKGKIERFHRTFREQFLNELNMASIGDLSDLNARLWAWIDLVYHEREHGGLEKEVSPIQRWRIDLAHIRPLGLKASKIDDLFYHRYERKVRKDGTLQWEGKIFEVPYALVNKKVVFVVDPHIQRGIRVESMDGEHLGEVALLDRLANNHRKRQRPDTSNSLAVTPTQSVVELMYQNYQQRFAIPTTVILEEK